MKKIILGLLITGYVYNIQAQFNCGHTEATQKFLQAHPDLADSVAKLEKESVRFANQFALQKSTNATIYTIPLVFHIIHENGTENISDAQIHDAVRLLNEDFQKLNADAADIIPAFQGIAADCEIQFQLAQKDPSGNCTNGIDRIESDLTNNADDHSKLNGWPREKYLNIWVVKTIGLSGAAGYAYRPSSAQFMPNEDGILMLSTYIGSIGTSSLVRSHSLTHEVGHCLDLPHTWGNSNTPGLASNCSDDDGIMDTPNTIGWTTCNLNGATCGSAIDNVQNFMDYAYCSNMYTTGQKNRMRAALNQSIAQRSSLWQSSNLANTGTNGVNTLCAANFNANSRSVCKGDSLQFYDASYHGATAWDWSFSNGNPVASNTQDPKILFTTEGFGSVSLTAQNANGTKSILKNNVVRILPSVGGHYTPFLESFEGGSYPNVEWDVYNVNNDAYTWSQVSNAAYSGNKCMKMNNFNSGSGKTDELISPLYDLSNLTSALITYKIAFVKKSTTTNDFLRISVSNDCGQTWTIRSMKGASLLQYTNIAQTASFTPTAINQWKELNFSLSSSYLTERTLFKFEFVSGEGNNLYLDDINITGTFNPVPIQVFPLNQSVVNGNAITIDWKAVRRRSI